MILTNYSKYLFAMYYIFTIIISGQKFPPETPWNNPHNAHRYMKLSNPNYLETVHDSIYGVDITKISDETVFNYHGGGIQHQYSKVQAWNSDMTYIWIGFNRLLDGNNYSLLKTFTNHMTDGRWANTEPNVRYFGDGNYLKKMDVTTGQVISLHYFPDFEECTIGPWEGNISADDKIVVVTDIDEGWDFAYHAAIYDIENDSVLAIKYFPNKFDWASVTPWGDYIVVNEIGDSNTKLYDLNFNFIRILSNERSHADFAIDTDGNKVFVEMCPIRMIQIDNGKKTDLLPNTIYANGTCDDNSDNPWICGHVSGRNFNLLGWVLISAGIDHCNNSFDGYYHKTEMFLLKLDGSGTIRHFGFSRSSYGSIDTYSDEENYLSEAKAVVSQDGKKIIFTSDWFYGNNLGEIVDYVVQFNPKGNHTISTGVEGLGQIELVPEGGIYPEGTFIEAKAKPDDSNTFSEWRGYISGKKNPLYFRIGKDTNLTALFLAPTDIEVINNKVNVLYNYPNPFSSSTTISYFVSKSARVKLTIVNSIGQVVEVLINKIHMPGNYSVSWSGLNSTGETLASGIYLYRLEIGDEEVKVNKLVIYK